jgi:tRNA pseudouridine55 synthase
MAEGVLPVCLGNATRLCDMIADRDKEYRAVMRLGLRTDTQDMTGTILEEAQPEVLSALTEDRIREAAESFIGDYSQIPPMYSALKVNGQRLYDLARQGKTVERKARQIRIHELEVLEIAVPFVTMRVRCSKGTYIRTLCEDIGSRLGCGGTMDSLLRTRVGQFTLENSWKLSQLEEIMREDPERITRLIAPVDSFFEDAPAGLVADDAVRFLANGNRLLRRQVRFDRGIQPADGGQVRMYNGDGDFFGVYTYSAGQGAFLPLKMFLPDAYRKS